MLLKVLTDYLDFRVQSLMGRYTVQDVTMAMKKNEKIVYTNVWDGADQATTCRSF